MAVVRTPVLVGPTAIGKTAVAVELATKLDGVIVSADSRQVYRHLDIGTGKPSRRERAKAFHYGLDLVDPGQRYSAGRFAREASEWITTIRSQRKLPLVVGGTGLYIKALAEGLFNEPVLDQSRRTDLAQFTAALDSRELTRWASRLNHGVVGGGRQRAMRAVEVALLTGRSLVDLQRSARAQAALEPWYVRLTAPRQVVHQRIAQRVNAMIHNGLVSEVAAVLAQGFAPNSPGLDALGIREVVAYLEGRLAWDQLITQIIIATRQYAKRQETWFRNQLPERCLVIDAARPAPEVARDITVAWEQAR